MTDFCLHIIPSSSSSFLVEEFALSSRYARQNTTPSDNIQSNVSTNNNKGVSMNYNPNMFDLTEDDMFSLNTMDKTTKKLFKNELSHCKKTTSLTNPMTRKRFGIHTSDYRFGGK